MKKIAHGKLTPRLVCLFAGLCMADALAGPAAPPPAEPAPAAMNAADEPARRERDPFWPFDYVKKSAGVVKDGGARRQGPSAARPVPSADDWAEAQKKLKIGGSIRLHNRLYVLIGGNMCGPGDVLGIRHGDYFYRFRVKSVEATNVRFEKLDRTAFDETEENAQAR